MKIQGMILAICITLGISDATGHLHRYPHTHTVQLGSVELRGTPSFSVAVTGSIGSSSSGWFTGDELSYMY